MKHLRQQIRALTEDEATEIVLKQADRSHILTALETAGLDLRKTKVVVLSAWDAEVGEVKNGEGIYGLRRVLALARSEI